MALEQTTALVEHPRTYRQLATYVCALQNTIPQRQVSTSGESGWTGYVDPSVVLGTGFAKTPEQLIEAPPDGLVVPLSYVEGFPTIDGIPFWERLDGEPIPFYNGFKTYRDMPYKLVASSEKGKIPLVQGRSVREVAMRVGENVDVVHSLSLCYHWKARCEAYDAFYQLSVELTRTQLALQMEHMHQKTARELFEMCAEYMQNNKEKLTPTTALKWLDFSTQLERISLGLPPDKPSGDAPSSTGTTVHVNTMNVQNNNTPVTVKDSKERITNILSILHEAGAIDDVVDVDVTDATEQEDCDDGV